MLTGHQLEEGRGSCFQGPRPRSHVSQWHPGWALGIGCPLILICPEEAIWPVEPDRSPGGPEDPEDELKLQLPPSGRWTQAETPNLLSLRGQKSP